MPADKTVIRMLGDATMSLASANNIVSDLQRDQSNPDLQSVIAAANQAQQAAIELRILEGYLRGKSTE